MHMQNSNLQWLCFTCTSFETSCQKLSSFCSSMRVALIHGYGNREHAQSVNLGQDLGGMKMDKVDWMLHTWFSYKHWHIVLIDLYTKYTAFISSLMNMEGLIEGG